MTAGLAFVFLGERLTGPQLLGGSLILTGVVLLRLGDRAASGTRGSLQASRP
jgi:drug/metabolite transporter (DMT)-like permease